VNEARVSPFVIAGLDPAIHAAVPSGKAQWIAGHAVRPRCGLRGGPVMTVKEETRQ